MKLLKRLFILIILAAVISPVVAVVMMVDDTPDIPVDLSLSHHGRFVAFAASLRGSPLRHSE